MKKSFIFALFVLVLCMIFAAVYYKHLRGARFAFTEPVADIGELLENSNYVAVDENVVEQAAADEPLEYTTQGPLTLPKGFIIETFAEDLGKVRDLHTGPAGGILASLPDSGTIVLLQDTNATGKADKQTVVASGLQRPHGIASICARGSCDIYIAEEHQVVKYQYDIDTHTAIDPQVLFDLPVGGRHWTRSVLVANLPDVGLKLLTSIGSSCDTCYEDDWRRSTILVSDLDGSNLEVYAEGLRNAVFMQQHPETLDLWVTEMGRDFLGDDLPPDEINIVQQGKDYGWPLCFGDNIHDTVFDTKQYVRSPCEDAIGSHIDLPAHSAPLGLSFVPEQGWPESIKGDLLIAFHGSWNRTEPTGYKIVRYALDEVGRYVADEDFISGWLRDDGALGRPVDMLLQTNGEMYISDDKAGVVYRVHQQ